MRESSERGRFGTLVFPYLFSATAGGVDFEMFEPMSNTSP